MPHIFNRVCIGWLWWRTPPVDLSVSKETLCSSGCVFWIVVLHKPVVLRIDCLYKRYQVFIQYLTVEFCIHYSFKYAGIDSSVPANTSPDMYFHWVFGAGFITRFLTFLPAPKATLCFHLNGGFISPNNIVKVRAQIVLCPLKSFCLFCARMSWQ